MWNEHTRCVQAVKVWGNCSWVGGRVQRLVCQAPKRRRERRSRRDGQNETQTRRTEGGQSETEGARCSRGNRGQRTHSALAWIESSNAKVRLASPKLREPLLGRPFSRFPKRPDQVLWTRRISSGKRALRYSRCWFITGKFIRPLRERHCPDKFQLK